MASSNGNALMFFVNGKKITDHNVDPELTLLSYLRRKLHLTGSKLGCGEGGCGACTVMLSRFDHQAKKILHYAVNACYTPVCAVHGMAVTTVEGVGSSNKLHPIQERLAKAHGLQCGFCTPGIVMSMYALLRNNPQPTSQGIEDALVGNLCRCTGYRPILEGLNTFTENGCCGNPSACCKKLEGDEDMICGLFTPSDFAPYDPSQEPIFPPELQLSDEFNSTTVRFIGKSMTWIRPITLTELLRLKLEIPDAKLVVGNAELKFELMGKQSGHQTLISPTYIPELNHVEVSNDSMTFGSSVTLTCMGEALKKRVEEIPRVNGQAFTALLEMFEMFGDVQLRNVSGIGSHIMTASPLSDLIPLLMAAGATVNAASHQGGSRSVALDMKFITGYRKTCLKPDEVLVSVTIPSSKENEYFNGYRVKKQVHRRDKAIAMVNAGCRVELDEKSDIVKEMTLSFGGTGPSVVMATQITNKTKGRKWDDNLLKDVLQMLNEDLPISPEGGMVEYRKALVQSYFFKFYTRVLSELHEKQPHTTTTPLPDFHESALSTIQKEETTGTQLFQAIPAGQSANDPIGRPLRNESGIQIVSGEAVYCDDIPPIPGELYFALVLSRRAHSKIISIDTSAATSLDGVHCYVGMADVAGKNLWAGGDPSDNDKELFASEKVLHVGQLIGGIVAESPELASKAAKLVKVVYEDLDYVLTIEEAIKCGSFFEPVLRLEDGNVEEQFEQSDHVIEGEFFIGAQSHFYMETQCCVVRPQERDEMMVHSASQDFFNVQKLVAEVLGISCNKVTVKTRRLGGGFGGKEGPSADMAAACAVAAKKVGKPVRIMLERDKDMQFVGTRHTAIAKYKVGCSKEGKLKAMEMELFFNAGFVKEISYPVVTQGLSSLHNAYKIPAYKVHTKVCKTNITSCCAMRGAGTPQANAIMESIMDGVIRKCGLSPEKVREMNFYQEGDVDNFFQEMPDIGNLYRCWNECLQRSDYYQRKEEVESFNRTSRWKKRGLAIVPFKRIVGFQLAFLNQASALVHVYTDGSVLLTHGGIEMGQGLYTKTIQIASRVLRIPPERIHINETSTDKIPNATTTSASTGTELVGNAVKIACETLMERLEPIMYENPKGSWDDWVQAAYFNRVSLSASGFFKYPGNISVNWDNLREGRNQFHFSYGVACSEVEIDCLTGDHQLKRTDIVMDIGESLNPALDIGQIEGAFIQGYGYHVTEELRYSQQGELLTRGPGMYRIPEVGDIPSQFNVTLLKGAPCKSGIYSAKGIGEPPLHLAVSVLMAIKEAISSARSDHGLSGQFELNSPATPERIRLACTDDFSDKAKTSEAGEDFFVRP
ncbi:xanthine dehydrogenase/oxidase-like [Glandiceps talaboti]